MSLLHQLAQHIARRPHRLALLEQIARQGSISGAAKQVGISYKTAWDTVDELNNLAEQPLVARNVGGKGGGGAQLTEEGERLLALYQRLESLQSRLLDAVSDEGDLALLGRLMLRTSARNQLHGRIAAMTLQGAHQRITLVLPGGQPLSLLVTHESSQRLGLALNLPVVALFKAGCVELLASASPSSSALNHLHGTLADLHACSEDAWEARIELADGPTLCALVSAEQRQGLQVGQDVGVQVDPAHILLGMPV